ncbi:hypothetical protein [Chitinophaga sp. ARDCPP14]|uniref:hypothetical protein n=1 Tax=Chitinophaga sp. ARDCPP14 TaxID=3391139 RepID=UPI003F521924
MKKKITSLLVEEKADQRIQFYLSLDLLKVNQACVCQDNTFEALAYLKLQPGFVPDYIFISSGVPVAHAALFIQQIRRLKRLATVPVIHFAAAAEQLPLDNLSTHGFSDCLPKQSDIYCLRDALKIIFEKDYSRTVISEPVPVLSNVASLIKEMMHGNQTTQEAPRRLSA